MIEIFEQAKERFDALINNNFDLTNDKIRHKVVHTYNGIQMSEYISDNLRLSKEDKNSAKLITLLHYIGRFDWAKQFKSFREYIKNINHAFLGIKILFENDMIREFIEDNQYDSIIKTVIANHSKCCLDEKTLSEKELLHSRLIRDADKMDSFRAKSIDNIYTMANITEEE